MRQSDNQSILVRLLTLSTFYRSNLGELLGAAGVMIFSEVVPTPLPWLRLDALFLK